MGDIPTLEGRDVFWSKFYIVDNHKTRIMPEVERCGKRIFRWKR